MENAHEEAVLFLVGSKADLEFYRKVTAEQAHEYLKEIGAVFYIETSAKTGHNIDLVFILSFSSSIEQLSSCTKNIFQTILSGI